MFFAWIYLTFVCSLAVASPEQWLRRSAILDREGRFHVSWGTGDREDIVFKVQVRTLGYVALGFSRDGTMVKSDIVIGWVTDGQVYLQDRYAEGNQMPDLDDQQDWELISGSENQTHTTLLFRRKLVTCDPQDFDLEYYNTIRLMHAYSFEDPVDEFTIHYHGSDKRGWKSFLLLQPQFQQEKEVEYWDVMTNNFSVSPEWHTVYWCRFFKTPKLNEKHHITTVETIILGGNRGDYVHHIVLLECAGADPEEFDPYLGADGYNWLDPNSPDVLYKCDGMFLAWGRGGSNLVLPEHIGFSLDPTPKYYMLQVHYDNYQRHTGTPGRAGLRLHYTPKLRPYDAGVLLVGAESSPNVIVPPGVKDFIVAGHSNPDCTGPGVPRGGLIINGLGLHTHLIGSRVKVRHFRDNLELPPLAFNKHYDPDYQEFHKLKEEVLFLPQDQLTLECTYDSTKRNQTTFGGFSTREEMCNSFVIHYPKLDGRFASMSKVPKNTAVQAIGSQELLSLTADQSDYDVKFVKFVTNYDWKRTAIRRFELALRMAKHETFCYLGTGHQSSVSSMVSYPEEFQEYKVQPICKDSPTERTRI